MMSRFMALKMRIKRYKGDDHYYRLKMVLARNPQNRKQRRFAAKMRRNGLGRPA